MSLYYQDESVTLYHGDCREVTAWLEADVLVSDVPYGIDYRSNQRRRKLARSIVGDKDTAARDHVLEAWRTACRKCSGTGRPSGFSEAVFLGECSACEGRGKGVPDPTRPALIFGTWRIPRPEGTRALLVWDTKGALGMGAMDIPWKPAHQEIYVLGKGFRGHRGTDVLSVAPVQSLGYNGRAHPHEKPVDLMALLVDKCPDGVIADPFAGVGPTLIAAKMLGRKAIGVEYEERYCEEAAKRLAQGVLDFGEATA